jgi:hypothetical protein
MSEFMRLTVKVLVWRIVPDQSMVMIIKTVVSASREHSLGFPIPDPWHLLFAQVKPIVSKKIG